MRQAETGGYLTVKDVQQRLKVSRAGVYRLFERGLFFIVVGRSRRIPEDGLVEWLAGQSEKLATPESAISIYRCQGCGKRIWWRNNKPRPINAPCLWGCGSRDLDFVKKVYEDEDA